MVERIEKNKTQVEFRDNPREFNMAMEIKNKTLRCLEKNLEEQEVVRLMVSKEYGDLKTQAGLEKEDSEKIEEHVLKLLAKLRLADDSLAKAIERSKKSRRQLITLRNTVEDKANQDVELRKLRGEIEILEKRI